MTQTPLDAQDSRHEQHPQRPHHAPHAHRDRPGHGPAAEHSEALAELLDLDGVLGAPVLSAALENAADALPQPPLTIVDLGAGTGTGTLALATRFPDATIHSLDASADMLDRLTTAASAAGVADRVMTHLVDLDGDWPAVVPRGIDVAWAALSLHHVTDPSRVLRQAFDALRPGGVLIVLEFTGATAYAPDDLGTEREGLAQRVVHELAGQGYPVTAEWTAALTETGFAPVSRHTSTFSASATTPHGARYLELQLLRSRSLLADHLSADDLAALDSAINALAHGASELDYTSGRAVWVAVRPNGAAR